MLIAKLMAVTIGATDATKLIDDFARILEQELPSEKVEFFKKPEMVASEKDGFAFIPIETDKQGVVSAWRVQLAYPVVELSKVQIAELVAAGQLLNLKIDNLQLHEQTIIDGLTKLYNRRYFDQQLELEMEKTKRYHTPFSLLIIDIDHFKSFNDTYGHQAGDEVLRVVGKVMKKNTRVSDLCFRYGGEEFAVILPHTDKEDAQRMASRIRSHTDATISTAERLRNAIGAEALIHGNKRVPIRVSIGVCTYAGKENDFTIPSLIKRADEALYRAKEAGRDRTEVVGKDERLHVLIVDDETEFCDMLSSYFKQRGYDVRATTSGEEAITLAKQSHYHVMLLDIRMPKISGIEVLRRLREEIKETKVVVVSAVHDENTKEMGYHYGICDYLEKPVSIEYLDKHLMARVLDSKA